MKHAAHRAERPRRRGRTAVAVAALLAAVVVLMGGQGTFAFWTDQAAVSSGGFSSGKLDITVDGSQGDPTAYTKTDLTLSAMVPGESVARIVTVANPGNADLTWLPTVTAGGDLGPALAVELRVGATATSTTTYPRTGTCTGGTPLTSGAASPVLARGGSQALCVRVSLPASTGNSYQNATSGSVSLRLAATQVVP